MVNKKRQATPAARAARKAGGKSPETKPLGMNLAYPHLQEALPSGFVNLLPAWLPKEPIRETLPPESVIPGVELVARLSFSHLAELLQLEDPLKRAFYEAEGIGKQFVSQIPWGHIFSPQFRHSRASGNPGVDLS